MRGALTCQKASILLVAIVFAILQACTADSKDQKLEQSFLNPPDSTRAFTWWHWVEGNISKEGITKDLEALKHVGIGGFQLFDMGWGFPHGGVDYNSESYHDHISHAISEADRLGLEMGINSASGWSCTGGPWIKPEHSMKMLIWSETEVSEGSLGRIHLGLPEFSPKQQPHNFYRDVAVIAFPKPQNMDFQIENWDSKSMTKIRTRSNGFVPDFREAPSEAIVKLEDVRILTDKMDPHGNLDWNPPSGKWIILRIGYSTTGAEIRPGTKGGRGLEVDKLSKEALDLHWKELLDKFVEDANGKEAFTTLLIDSYEVGCQNWTEGFETLFVEKCGYNLIPHLVCVTGRVLESTEYSERVLWDLRSTVADLMHENYFNYFAEKSHALGFKLACEPYGTGSFDAPRTAMLADLPMTEFWHKDEPWVRRNLWEWTSLIVPSAAHLTGRSVVGAEAFTRMIGDWTVHPYRMKVWGDRAFTKGVNRYYFHTSAHQPWNDRVKPGMTMGQFGTNFHRNNTWFYQSKGWLDYIARCQYIMQAGSYQSDLLVLYGDERGFDSFIGEKEALDVDHPAGFKIDLGGVAILDALSVDSQGDIGVNYMGKPLSLKYKMLVLKRGTLLSAETAEKLGNLADQGAVVIAQKPVRTPGLSNYPESETALQELVKKYWESGIIQSPENFEGSLRTLEKDCELPDKMEYCHHRIKLSDFYFVTNQSYDPRQVACIFRVSGKQPELWNPETGEITQASNWKQLDDGRTEVHLNLTSAGSIFVVFRNSTHKRGQTSPLPVYEEVAEIKDIWEVSFDPYYGPKEPVVFERLIPWNEHFEEDVKFYSGTATYRTSFDLDQTSSSLFIDLGDVEVMAEVKLNGKALELLWKPPYRVDISSAIRSGRNELEIEVTNLWPNRLIGDAQYPDFGEPAGKKYKSFPQWLLAGEAIPESAKRRTFAAYNHWNKDAALLPSGLVGPVRLLEKRIPE